MNLGNGYFSHFSVEQIGPWIWPVTQLKNGITWFNVHAMTFLPILFLLPDLLWWAKVKIISTLLESLLNKRDDFLTIFLWLNVVHLSKSHFYVFILAWRAGYLEAFLPCQLKQGLAFAHSIHEFKTSHWERSTIVWNINFLHKNCSKIHQLKVNIPDSIKITYNGYIP